MRGETDREKIEAVMSALAQRVHVPGCIYFTGSGTAVLFGSGARWSFSSRLPQS